MNHKVTHITFLEPFTLKCWFANREVRILELSHLLKPPYAEKILNETVFKTAKVGTLGQIYWEKIGQIQLLDRSIAPCEYDMSGEFVYENSKPFKEKKLL